MKTSSLKSEQFARQCVCCGLADPHPVNLTNPDPDSKHCLIHIPIICGSEPYKHIFSVESTLLGHNLFEMLGNKGSKRKGSRILFVAGSWLYGRDPQVRWVQHDGGGRALGFSPNSHFRSWCKDRINVHYPPQSGLVHYTMSNFFYITQHKNGHIVIENRQDLADPCPQMKWIWQNY